jgi:hypothetical protein
LNKNEPLIPYIAPPAPHRRPFQRIERRILLAEAHVDVREAIGRDVSLG